MCARGSPRTCRVRAFILAPFVLAAPASVLGSPLPDAVFVQFGGANQTRAATVGVAWDSSLERRLGPIDAKGSWELAVSRWTYDKPDNGSRSSLIQLILTPVLTLRPGGDRRSWFVEAGIGASLMSSLYETGRKRFSTRFNFADHLSIGYAFGARREHELALRIEHFSNAGISQPNPGENFIQARYVRRFE